MGALTTAVAAAVVCFGWYDVSADRPHRQWVYSAMETTLHRAVRRRARTIDAPPLDAPELARRGAVCFRTHCQSCHGAPGVAPQAAGLAMQPLPGPLVDVGQRWHARELAWITRHGIRMSGMPAWQHRLADADIWALAAFMLQWLPAMSPKEWQALQGGLAGEPACELAPPRSAGAALAAPAGETSAAERGRLALKRHACHGCHVIPGVVGSQRDVGPPLVGFGQRTTIAGVMPNNADNLTAWIRDPQRFDPASAMPASGVGEADARAIAAYLLSLR